MHVSDEIDGVVDAALQLSEVLQHVVAPVATRLLKLEARCAGFVFRDYLEPRKVAHARTSQSESIASSIEH